MRWLKMTAVMGTLLAAGAGLSASVLTVGQDKEKAKEKTPQAQQRERVIVSPQIQVLGGGGVRIGVELRDVNADIARERKLPAVEGALVERVEDDGPAAKAGIRQGDVIASLDGERVRSVRQLQRMVGETPAGREVKVTVLRDGRKVDLSVTPEATEGPLAFGRLGRDLDHEIRRGVEEGLRALPRDFTFRREGPNVYRFEGPGGGTFRFEPRDRVTPLPPAGDAPRRFRLEPGPDLRRYFEGTPTTGRLGATVQDLTPQLEEFFGVKEGVLVATVDPDSPGARAGLKAGDVITSVNGTAVASPDALVRALREPADGAEISLGVVREKKAQTLKVRLAATPRGGIKT